MTARATKRVRLTAAGVFVLLVALILWPPGDAPKSAEPTVEVGCGRASTHGPRYVRTSIRPSEDVLVAGDPGFLHVDITLPDATSTGGRSLRWDHDARPLVLCISSPSCPGIQFDDRTPGDVPRRLMLVQVPIPDDDVRTLSARVGYNVESRTKSGPQSLLLEVSAPLLTEEGERIQDAGVVCCTVTVDTHLRVKLLVLLVIAVTIFLFIVEWVRVDVVAILMMVSLPVLGLLDAKDTFRGLSSNAVVAIIGVMVISSGLNRAGVVGRVTRPLLQMVQGSATRLISIFSGVIAVISSVMQNTGAAVLFLPAIRIAAFRKLQIPLSRVLMPIGMAAILGGTMTMVGTSPLILLNDLLPPGMAKFGLLELTPIGAALVVSGIVYLSFAARVFLAHPRASHGAASVGPPRSSLSYYDELDGPFEIFIPPEFRPGAGPLQIARIRREREVNIVAIFGRGGVRDTAPSPAAFIFADLTILAFGPRHRVEAFVEEYKLVLRPEPVIFRDSVMEPATSGSVEVVISPRSTMVGQTIKDVGFRRSFRTCALALHQDEKTYYREMADRPLRPGDAILVYGPWQQLRELHAQHQNFIIISQFETEFQEPEKARPAVISFGIALVLMLVSSLYFQGRGYNPIPLSVCLMIGAVGMILSRVMTITEAYRAVDWRTVFLLGGLIPLGLAVSQTGTAAWLAQGIVGSLGHTVSPLLLLFVLAVLSCAFTLVISNVGACALLVPLGISMARQVGLDPRLAAIVVGIGVSNSFILPTHQVNALYMGPGEYRTVDYVKVGGILSVIYIVVLVFVTYLLYA